MAGVLYAIPTPLGGTAVDALPVAALAKVKTLQHFVVENAKSARAFLKSAGCDPKELQILELNEKSNLQDLLRPLMEGHSIGLLSEAGCPAIADPEQRGGSGSSRGIRVVPRIGPSSMVLALMASGWKASASRSAATCRAKRRTAERRQELEARSRRERETQIFIETPYRNDVMWAPCWKRFGRKPCFASPPISRLPARASRPIGPRAGARAPRNRQAATVFLCSVNDQAAARGKLDQVSSWPRRAEAARELLRDVPFCV